MVLLAVLLSVLVDTSGPKFTEAGQVFTSVSSGRAKPINKMLLLELVNRAREKGCNCGTTYYPSVPPLEWNDQLEKSATLHCGDMLRIKYFSHIGSDGSDAGSRIEQAGYHWRFYGENIGMGYSSEQEVI